jgi:hypothetical protein
VGGWGVDFRRAMEPPLKTHPWQSHRGLSSAAAITAGRSRRDEIHPRVRTLDVARGGKNQAPAVHSVAQRGRLSLVPLPIVSNDPRIVSTRQREVNTIPLHHSFFSQEESQILSQRIHACNLTCAIALGCSPGRAARACIAVLTPEDLGVLDSTIFPWGGPLSMVESRRHEGTTHDGSDPIWGHERPGGRD